MDRLKKPLVDVGKPSALAAMFGEAEATTAVTWGSCRRRLGEEEFRSMEPALVFGLTASVERGGVDKERGLVLGRTSID